MSEAIVHVKAARTAEVPVIARIEARFAGIADFKRGSLICPFDAVVEADLCASWHEGQSMAKAVQERELILFRREN